MKEHYQEYIKIKPYPTKPKRIWVNVLKGKATKAGERWIVDCREWEIGFLEWLLEKLTTLYQGK